VLWRVETACICAVMHTHAPRCGCPDSSLLWVLDSVKVRAASSSSSCSSALEGRSSSGGSSTANAGRFVPFEQPQPCQVTVGTAAQPDGPPIPGIMHGWSCAPVSRFGRFVSQPASDGCSQFRFRRSASVAICGWIDPTGEAKGRFEINERILPVDENGR
jgi:hypothetical protein